MLASLHDDDGRVTVAGLLRRTSSPLTRRRAPRDRERSPSTRRSGSASTGAPAVVRREGLLDARAHLGAADARLLRHLGRLPGRGREDDHPGAREREGQLPPRARSGARRHRAQAARRTSSASRRPACACGSSTCTAAGLTSRRPTTPSTRSRSARSARRSASRRSSCARAGASRSCARSPTRRASRACSWASASPTRTRTRPNEWLDLENYHLGIKSAAYLYDEIRGWSEPAPLPGWPASRIRGSSAPTWPRRPRPASARRPASGASVASSRGEREHARRLPRGRDRGDRDGRGRVGAVRGAGARGRARAAQASRRTSSRSGALLVGVAIWIGTSGEPSLRVGDARAGGGEGRRAADALVRDRAHRVARRGRARDGQGRRGRRDDDRRVARRATRRRRRGSSRRRASASPRWSTCPEDATLPDRARRRARRCALEPPQVVGKHCAASGQGHRVRAGRARVPAVRARLPQGQRARPTCACGASLVELQARAQTA